MRLIGQTLGKYRITEHLGSGGMAEVYKAYQPGLDRYVAIKVLHSFLAQEEDFLTRFQREAKFAAMLRHPNIIQVYDFDYDKDGNAYYMVMEHIDGISLKTQMQKMAQKGEMTPLEESTRIVTAIANALDYAHQRGMVHRDIKPANIMFNEDKEPILTDFGIAKMVDVAGLTASGAMVGTPAYMAPEQGMGQAGDERSDIYSLGVVLYQLTTGHRPFDADTPLGIALKHINAPLPPPIVVNPDLPRSIEAVTLKALAKDPDKRFQTAKEFATALKQAAAGEPVEPPPETAAQPPAPPLPQDEGEWKYATIPSAPAVPSSIPSPAAQASGEKPRRRWIAAAAAGIAGLAIIGGIIALVATGAGQRAWAAIVSQAPTETAANAPTPDLASTQMAAQSTQIAAQFATRDALATLETSLNATLTPTPAPSATPDLDATSTAACVFDLEITNDPPVWPAVLMPGQTFTKRWNVRNSGTCPWPAESQVVFASGSELSIVEISARPNLGQLPPGDTAQISLSLEAPSSYDIYTSRWNLRYGGGTAIGPELVVTCEVGPTPTPYPTTTPTPTPTPAVSPTPYEELLMYTPGLASCDEPKARGRVEWGYEGGPSSEYQFFYGGVTPETKLTGPFRNFEGFPHTETYFTVSGEFDYPVPDECGRGDYGRCGGPAFGYEIVWHKVYYTNANCP